MGNDTVLWAVDRRGVATVTLNRPQVNNAYNGDLIDGLHAGYLNLPATTYPDGTAHRRFMNRLQEKLSALPGVERASLATSLPVSGFRSHINIEIESPATSVTERGTIWNRRLLWRCVAYSSVNRHARRSAAVWF